MNRQSQSMGACGLKKLFNKNKTKLAKIPSSYAILKKA